MMWNFRTHGTRESQGALIVVKTFWGSLNNVTIKEIWLVNFSFFFFDSTNSEASKGKQNQSQTHTLKKTHKHMSIHSYSFALSETNRDSRKQGWKISQIQEPLFPAGLAHKTIQQANSSASNTFTTFLCLPACLSLLLLPLCTSHSSPPLLLYSPPHPCWHATVKGSSRWVQLWNQPSGGHIQEGFLYVCGFLVKLQISPVSRHLQCLRLYHCTVWWLAGIYIYIYIDFFNHLFLL